LTLIGDDSGDVWDSTTRGFIEQIDPEDRYGAEWARQAQARVFDIDRRCREWAESLALLTATASTSWPGEDTQIPPVVHFNRGLRKSREARQKALSRALRRCQHRAVRVYGVGSDGCLHRHTAVYIGSEVDRCTLRPWADAHVANSPLAREEGHGDGAVRVDTGIEVDGESNVSSVAGYLMQNLPSCDTRGDRAHGIQSAPTNVQRGATVLDRVGAEPVTVGPVVSPASE
jgi:hypothetical protein